MNKDLDRLLNMKNSPTTDPKLNELLKKAAEHEMTPEEIAAQRESYVRGEMDMLETSVLLMDTPTPAPSRENFEPTKEVISLHGLGFIQVKLGGNQRLHVWHPDLPRRKCFAHSQIHDHRFSFKSTVLVGMQRNLLYVALPPDAKKPTTHWGYLHEGPRTEFGNRPWIRKTDPYRIIPARRPYQDIGPGETYTMDAYEFHATEPLSGKVATLMTKTREFDRGATSLCEIGIEPDVDFNRKQLCASELWRFVLDVLGAETNTLRRLL